MQLKQLFTDDEAVSPVIGVILMVAITVILAAVIGTFVLGIGSSQGKAPQASFDYSNESGSGGTHALLITHASGDNIDPTNVELRGSAMSSNKLVSDLSNNPPDPWTAGTTANVTDSELASPPTDEKLNMVWINPQGGDTKIISDYTFPN
jgi:flagellin-like protein